MVKKEHVEVSLAIRLPVVIWTKREPQYEITYVFLFMWVYFHGLQLEKYIDF